MATQTVNELVALGAAPATNDVIPIWDTSASAYKKVTVANFLGGYMTGGGTVATGGYTLTVPATGTAMLLTGAQTVAGVKTFSSSPNFRAGASMVTETLADDATVELVATYGAPINGILFVLNTAAAAVCGMIAYRAGATNYCTVIAEGSTAIVAGTADISAGGTDGSLNVAAISDGRLQVRNRLGAERSFLMFIIG